MEPRIALLRGVNIGGNRLLMAELREELEALGLEDVRTYIQSGNVVFGPGSDAGEGGGELARRIADAIEARAGFRPRVLILSVERFREAMAANPFPEAEDAPGTLHLYFLAEPAAEVDLDALAEVATDTERFHLGERVLYLHTPDGFGRSKLAGKVESILGVPATARNWRTVVRLWEMVEE